MFLQEDLVPPVFSPFFCLLIQRSTLLSEAPLTALVGFITPQFPPQSGGLFGIKKADPHAFSSLWIVRLLFHSSNPGLPRFSSGLYEQPHYHFPTCAMPETLKCPPTVKFRVSSDLVINDPLPLAFLFFSPVRSVGPVPVL